MCLARESGQLSCSDTYVCVALSDATVHVFSLQNASRKLSFQDACGKPVWAHAIINDTVVVGSFDGSLSARSILER